MAAEMVIPKVGTSFHSKPKVFFDSGLTDKVLASNACVGHNGINNSCQSVKNNDQ